MSVPSLIHENTQEKYSATHTVTLFNCHLHCLIDSSLYISEVCASLTGALIGGAFIRIHFLTSSGSQDKKKQIKQRETEIKNLSQIYSKQHTQVIIGKMGIFISFKTKGRERMIESKGERKLPHERRSCTLSYLL